MLKIYVARHGQDADNVVGILNGHRNQPLTALGLKQADFLADFIKDREIVPDKIYCSPLQRAQTTAEIVANKLELPVPEVLETLIERDFGSMTGKKISDVEVLCAPDIIKSDQVIYFLKADESETFPDCVVRAKAVLKFVSDKYKDGSVLLVGHGDFGKMLYAAYFNLPWQEVLKTFHFGNTELVLLSEDTKPEDAHIFITEQFNK